MRILTILATGFLATGCTFTSRTSNLEAARAPYVGRARYTPTVTTISRGYRNVFPTGQAPEVTYLDMENQSVQEMHDLHENFTRPLCNGDYDRFIAAIVVQGAYESIQIQFTLWLHDGRQLDSGRALLRDQDRGVPHRPDKGVGTQLYRHAETMLRKAVSPRKLEQAKRDPGFIM